MIENLKRLREPVAWIVIAVTALSIVLALVRFGMEVSSAVPLTTAAETMALTAMNLTLVVLCVALTWVSIFVAPPVPRAGLIAWWAAMLVTIGSVLTLIGAIIGLFGADGAISVIFGFLGVILDIVLKGVGTVTLWLMYGGLRRGRFAASSAVGNGDSTSEENPWPPTTWSPGQAAGAAWTSADDAAAGAPATGVGTPGTAVGWGGAPGAQPWAEMEPPHGVTPRGTSAESDPYRLDESE